MEYGDRPAATFHYNCLLMAQADADVPDIAAMTFENMQYGSEEMRPDTESYNWLMQAHTRHAIGDRFQEVVDLLGEMVEDHRHVQPNMRTLLVECFAKYSKVQEALRHFRALVRHPGAMRALHQGGRFGDPLSLFLRALTLEGNNPSSNPVVGVPLSSVLVVSVAFCRIPDLALALDAMLADGQPLPRRALLVNSKGRSLVSSWIEPIKKEADLGYSIDYVARYYAEGGLTGTRKRSLHRERQPDAEGFATVAPKERSFKQFCHEERRIYSLKLIRKLKLQGVRALGEGATEETLRRVVDRLRKETAGEREELARKPKAASKMLVQELKEELAAQGLPTDGTRPLLYQRVQKARRINRARGRPLWIPPQREEEAQADDEVDLLLARLDLKNDGVDFWKTSLAEAEDEEAARSLAAKAAAEAATAAVLEEDKGTGLDALLSDAEVDESEDTVAVDDDGDDAIDEDEDEEDEEEEGEAEADEGEEPPEMLTVKLARTVSSPAEEKVAKEQAKKREGEWLDLTLEEKVAILKRDNLLSVEELYTIADAWGWDWEKELREREPARWTAVAELDLALRILSQVVELGGTPTEGDMGMLTRAAMRVPRPDAIVSLVQQCHRLNYVFGVKMYVEIVDLCLEQGEKDAAIAVVAEMEDARVRPPSDLLDRVLLARRGSEPDPAGALTPPAEHRRALG
eukprot:SM000064S19711  [mRNA]  locus=s64:33689:38036:+ [translate_table: standard]